MNSEMPQLDREQFLRQVLSDNPHLDLGKLQRVRELIERAKKMGVDLERGYTLISPFSPATGSREFRIRRRSTIRTYFVETGKKK